MMTQPKSTFKGERGGDAYDAELLALLRGVSANSGANDRFAGNDDDDDDDHGGNPSDSNGNTPAPKTEVAPPPASPPPARRLTTRDPNEIPPWKRGKNRTPSKSNASTIDDVVVATPSPRRSVPVEDAAHSQSAPSPPIVFNTSKSTFQGERGGDAHDEELLALLRGVSAKSGANDRFSGNDDENVNDENGPVMPEENNTGRKNTYASAMPSKIPSPSKSTPSSSRRRDSSELPPWKRGKAKGGSQNKSKQSALDDDLVVVAAKPNALRPAASSKTEPSSPPPNLEEPTAQPLSQEVTMGGGGDFKQKSTFQGDRGGDAHDEELLALLRGVSAKSSSADRFSGGYDDDNQAAQQEEQKFPKANPEFQIQEEKKEKEISQSNNQNQNSLPPWKQGKAQRSSKAAVGVMDVVVVAKPPSVPGDDTRETEQPPLSREAIIGGGGNFKQKSTFQGDRGGDAHDEELLALLRGVSAKSSSVDRFAGSEDTATEILVPAQPASPPPKPAPKPARSRDANQLPPWKRGKAAKIAMDTSDVVVAAKPAPVPVADTAEKEEAPLNQEAIIGGGGDFKQKSTFQGDRGGDAHDEELLALLRGVSAKSSSADRFSGVDDGDISESAPSQPAAPVSRPNPSPQRQRRDPNELPPWKRGKPTGTKPKLDDTVMDVAVAVKAKPAIVQAENSAEQPLSQEAIMGGGGDFKQKSKFQGDRGGDAHDDELLALLRGVSAKSSSADRFAGGTEAENKGAEPTQIVRDSSRDLNELPPWKRGNGAHAKSESENVSEDVLISNPEPRIVSDSAESEVVAAPLGQETIMGGGGDFKQSSTFKGDRGGDAHDEELLALLRGVSAQSGAADRFAGLDHDDNIQQQTMPQPSPPSSQSSSTTMSSPKSSEKKKKRWKLSSPWKKKNKKKEQETGAFPVAEDVVVVASAPKQSNQQFDPAVPGESAPDGEMLATPVTIEGGRGDFQQGPSSFKGERGGDANDPELLALLRGVSSSVGTDRFADEPVPQSPAEPAPIPASAPAPQQIDGPIEGGRGDFQQGTSSFKGERGGDANDPELLALLRGVSSSVGTEQFADKPDPLSSAEPAPTPAAVPEVSQIDVPIEGGRGDFQQGPSTFKGERGGDANDPELLALLRGVSTSTTNDRFAEVDDKSAKQRNEVAAATPTTKKAEENMIQGGQGNFKQESTFQGERGGDAHDEELLALLRGVSSSNASGKSDRFSESSEPAPRPPKPEVPKPAAPRQHVVSKLNQPPSPFPSSSSSLPPPFPTGDGEEEIVLTLDDLPSAFSDKDWNIRKKSYQVLRDSIIERTKGNQKLGNIDANTIIPGLDDIIPTLFAEKNAMALEWAMKAGTEYSNACRGAASEEQAISMMKVLLKGNGLSSPRPTSAKAATALVLKIMEVGSTVSSLQSVVSILVDKGLTAKKPKVVQLSASLILDATHSFGAAHLPLASITSALPKVLTHSNKKIRDTGMEIVAELRRSFGSKDPLQNVIGKMQKSQVKDLDAQLAKRAEPIPMKTGLRCQSTSGGASGGKGATCAADVFAALKAGNEEFEKQKFANRPAVKLMAEISKTNYASELQEAKWSRKVGALDKVLQCGGMKPYKLAQPSSSNNYVPLINDMKGLFKHTHFAVVSKALGVLAMLAEGVGEKLYPNLRPLLPRMLQLSKDKKLTKAVSACLDSCFGNVFSLDHLLDSDSSIPDAANESKEKNALARMSALDYLNRCVTRGDSAGPRASLSPSNAKACGKFAAQKLNDSDANARKSALKILASLQKIEDDDVQSALYSVFEDLQQTNTRAYKTLFKTANMPVSRSSIPKATSPGPKKTSSKTGSASPGLKARSAASTKSAPLPRKPAAPISSKVASSPLKSSLRKAVNTSSHAVTDCTDGDVPTYEAALEVCASFGIPLWDEPSEDEGGVLACIISKKWQSRQAAIKELIGFLNTRPQLDDRDQVENDSNCVLVVVKEHTRKFKESNMNVTRCILELFSAVCDYHERSQFRLAKWVTDDGTALAVEKIADRKLSSLSKGLLTLLCLVHPPHAVIVSACMCAEKLRSPLAHEEFLVWMKDFCNDFGAVSIASNIQEIITFLLSECGAKNIKVKRAAFATVGLMHVQLGPTVKAVALASIKNSSLRSEIEKVFEDNPFDSSLSSKQWPKTYILAQEANGDGGADMTGPGMNIELPKLDLIAELPPDCLSRMGSKNGHTAWKDRKAALEDVENALQSSSGLLDTSKLRPLADLLKAMRERLSDSQTNLRPLAVRLIGLVLGAVEGDAQGKLGKANYGAIMNAAINDKRKVMNDAAMEALKRSISIPEIKGEGLNHLSLESYVVALTGELEGSEFKSVGIAGILTTTKEIVPNLPNLDKVSSQRGESLGSRFSRVLVNALSSSKAEIRSTGESLLSLCIASNVFSMQTTKKCIGKMVPAKQRTIGIILAKISSSSSESSETRTVKEASPRKTRPASRMLPPAEKILSKPRVTSAIQNPRTTVRSTAPKKRLATSSKLSGSQEEDEADNDTTSNPLVVFGNSTGMQKSRAALRSLTWPEYPEEPSGTQLYNGLKKAWAPIIPQNATKKLFPDRGVRNQNDVNDGFELLRQAIRMDMENQGSVVSDQLHFVLRWSVYVMGCKESAVGLTGLLDMLAELIVYLNERMHEFSDLEVSLFVPFVFEKASIAKGRFKDTYMDLIHSIKANVLLPEKRLGSLVCVPIMENSSQAKARLMACQNCCDCVEAIGLSGIGKKGVLAAAKVLSTEKLPENRAAFLDLMVLLLSKMQNDIQRLSKICGQSLSLKAKGMIEEHMNKVPTPSKASAVKTPSPHKSSRLPRPSQLTPPTKLSFSPKSEYVAPAVFQDELPALDLRRALRERGSPSTSPAKTSGLPPPSFSSTVPEIPTTSSYSSNPSNIASSSGDSEPSGIIARNNLGSSLPQPAASPIGAAASLRARLMKIREKNNLGPLPTKPSESIEIPMTTASPQSNFQQVEKYLPVSSQHSVDSFLDEILDDEPVLETFLERIQKLLEKNYEIFETDDDLLSCTDVLKNIHAAVSKQANLAVMISPSGVENLREEIKERVSELVGMLTQLIRFGFHCHPDSLSAGMSVPLLSVNLASLMAIFRSNDLATLVSVDDLTLLIKEAGTALLDPRLAQSPKSGEISLGQIDEATSTQMVRAINKLAVQAATGAARENSIQALILLQTQLLSNINSGVNGRLSRVVTKLSARVIKAEESASNPFSSDSMDMETVLCFLEDTLEACTKEENAEVAIPTENMVKSIVTAILKARRESTSIRKEMDDLRIDPYSSQLGALVGSVASDLGLMVSKPSQNISDNNNVGSLVSAVVSATQGEERAAAIDALKSYRAIHGDKDLMMHLEDVSPAFRSYLVTELSETATNSLSPKSASTNAMSERIKNLRSKLNATDGALSQGGLAQIVSENSHASKPLDQQQRMRNLRQKLNATQAALSHAASTFPPPSTERSIGHHVNIADSRSDHSASSVPSSNPTINAFRERLAAAKEKQAANKLAAGELASPAPTTSASTRAAALRARLQAVKKQTQS